MGRKCVSRTYYWVFSISKLYVEYEIVSNIYIDWFYGSNTATM